MKTHYWLIKSKHERHGKMVMWKLGDSPVDCTDGNPCTHAKERNAFLYYHRGYWWDDRKDHQFFLAEERGVPWDERYFFTFDTEYQLLALCAENMRKQAEKAGINVMKQEQLDKHLDHEELLWTLAWLYLHRIWFEGKP